MTFFSVNVMLTYDLAQSVTLIFDDLNEMEMWNVYASFYFCLESSTCHVIVTDVWIGIKKARRNAYSFFWKVMRIWILSVTEIDPY